jgi:hypothetical protein
MQEYPVFRIAGDSNCKIVTNFEHVTLNYPSQLIALLKELTSLAKPETETYDVRKIEQLIAQQVKISMPSFSLAISPKTDVQPCYEELSSDDHNY